MRLLPDIRYGMRRYPENVARRLRSLNMPLNDSGWHCASERAFAPSTRARHLAFIPQRKHTRVNGFAVDVPAFEKTFPVFPDVKGTKSQRETFLQEPGATGI